jgi:hypothetical protein
MKEKYKKILLVLVFLSALCTYIILNFLSEQKIVDYKMQLTVGNHIGFDLNTSVITFGMVTPSSSAVRHLNLKNGDQKNKFQILAFGDMASWIKLSENDFILQPYEKRTLNITAQVPENADLGNYTGILRVIIENYE